MADDRRLLDRARPDVGPGRAVAASPNRRDVLAAFQAALRLEAHNLSRPGASHLASFFWQQLSNRILWPSSPIGQERVAALVEIESEPTSPDGSVAASAQPHARVPRHDQDLRWS